MHYKAEAAYIHLEAAKKHSEWWKLVYDWPRQQTQRILYRWAVQKGHGCHYHWHECLNICIFDLCVYNEAVSRVSILKVQDLIQTLLNDSTSFVHYITLQDVYTIKPQYKEKVVYQRSQYLLTKNHKLWKYSCLAKLFTWAFLNSSFMTTIECNINCRPNWVFTRFSARNNLKNLQICCQQTSRYLAR